MFTAIMMYDQNNKIEKYVTFYTQAEADNHVTGFLGTYPNAFVVPTPNVFAIDYITVDSINKTISYDSTTHISDKAMRDWERSMSETDSGLPRFAEDIINAMNSVDKANVDAVTLAKYDAKILLRGNKPI
jgi:hypothetical protein